MIHNQKTTALERLEEYVRKTPDHCVLIYEPEERITFRELWQLSGKIYAWLKSKGIGAEDVVMYCLPRGVMLYACMAGTMRAGAAFVLTETENDPERTAFIRQDSRCKLYVDESCQQEILDCQPLEGYEPVRLHNLCYIAYTSGTTGHPKGVMHEYGSLDNAWKAAIVDGKPLMGENDIFLTMSPMNFVAAPILFTYSCSHGCAIAMMPYRYAGSREGFSDYLERAGVTCGYVTPSTLRKQLPFRYPWHMCILSAEPADGLFVPGMECYNTYASTESGCLLSVYKLPKAMAPAPVGRSYSDVVLTVVDEEGREVPRGEAGEICFRNPYVRGYIDPTESRTKLGEDGLFHTGDAGTMDAEGILMVRGRIDEMFKVGGYRIEPDEILDAVRKVSSLMHAVVRGFVYRDISSIIVFYTDDVRIDPVLIRHKLSGLLPEYMIPTNYIHLEEFPLLLSGKINKLALLPPEGSWDTYSNYSGTELSVCGKGRTATVYEMGEDKVLKLFNPSVPYETAFREMEKIHLAHSYGIPMPDAYDIVRSGAAYGILMDRMGGTVFERIMEKHPEQRMELIGRFAQEVKAIHQIRIAGTDLPDCREDDIRVCGELDPSFCTDEEARKIRAVFECIPPAETFIHGDCHPGNAMVDRGRIQFIDLSFCGKGHPVFDHLCMYSHLLFLPSYMAEAEAEALYDRYLEVYYAGEDAPDIPTLKVQIRGIHAARVCLASVRIPGVFSDEMLAEVKRRAIRFSDEYCQKDQNE